MAAWNPVCAIAGYVIVVFLVKKQKQYVQSIG